MCLVISLTKGILACACNCSETHVLRKRTYRKRLLVFSHYRDKGHSTQSTKLEPIRSQEVEQDENIPDNKESLMKTPSENEKEEGNYEELICLVRQFYVERPINPSAIAHQNIETC